MKLFFQVVAFIAVLWALVWAKKHFLDKPKPEEHPAAAASITAPVSLSQQAQASAAAPAEADQGNAIANLLQKFVGSSKPEDRAQARMDAFMKAWKEGGTSLNDSEQAASCLFARGQRVIPSAEEIRAAYDGFTAFRRQKDLYTNITGYSIVDSKRRHDDAHGDYTVFTVVINSQLYAIGVPDKANPMFWVE
ncbi:MAG TPA: hypothetical protein VJ853_02340 [Thermoanaerobaculia bacterium]|nr:hypothetical protein [Thermoanaerobaculia bacterium]